MSFHDLCDLAVQVHAGESELLIDELASKVQNAYDSSEITEPEYSWLMFGLEALD